jgi:glycosyltransferase involved in cell wall biosynthesis
MSELSRQHKVIYVNQRKGVREGLSEMLKISSWNFGLRRINENLLLVEAPWIFPKIYKLRYLDAIIERAYHGFIKLLSTLVGRGRLKIVYIWEPAFSSVVRYWRKYPYIYHPYDLFEKYTFGLDRKKGGEPEAAGTSEKEQSPNGERELVQNAFLFYTVSALLCEHYHDKFGRRPKLLLNGVQDLYFGWDDEKLQREAKERLAKFPSRKIGFSGSVKGSLDLDVIVKSARSLEDHTFVFVGMIRRTNIKKYDDKLDGLFSLKNVVHLGSVRLELLPYLLREMDALIMIYSNDKSIWTHYSGPAKLFEYMAIGKPIISTPHPVINEYGKYISIVENADQLIAAVRKVDKGLDDRLLNEMVQIARQNTWHEKEKVILEDIRNGLSLGPSISSRP